MCGNRSDFKTLDADAVYPAPRAGLLLQSFAWAAGTNAIGTYGRTAAWPAKRSARARVHVHAAQTTVTC
jgi:hypothetical protein